jgi:enoyl-CoA hydratase/carnithine racemase
VGLARAKELVLTGRRISANEAFEMGLVARVVKREELPNATMELAEQVCRSSPVAVREAKQAMNRGWALDLEAALEVEDLAWRRAVASDDRREGIAAFNEKRDPIWKGR